MNQKRSQAKIKKYIKGAKMKMTSVLNKKAWAIRRKASLRLGVPVLEISWSECLRQAKMSCVSYLDSIVKKHSPFSSFKELLKRKNPRMNTVDFKELFYLANAYDAFMYKKGKSNRVKRVRGYYAPTVKINS